LESREDGLPSDNTRVGAGEPARSQTIKTRCGKGGMMDSHPPEEDGKTGKPRKGKPAKADEVPAVPKVKSTIHLTVEADRRLNIHCAMMRVDRSAMVEGLINDHLRRYVVQDRARPESSKVIQLARPEENARETA
jgi:hypothetical protein